MEENHQYLTCKFIDEKTNLQHEIKNQTTEILISLLNIVDHKLNWLDKSKKNLINILQPIINIIIKNSNFILGRRAKELTFNCNHTRNIQNISASEIHGNESVKKELYRLLSHLNMGNIIEPQVIQGLYKLFTTEKNKFKNQDLYNAVSVLEKSYEKLERLQAKDLEYSQNMRSKVTLKKQNKRFKDLLVEKKKYSHKNNPNFFRAKLEEEKNLSKLENSNLCIK